MMVATTAARRGRKLTLDRHGLPAVISLHLSGSFFACGVWRACLFASLELVDFFHCPSRCEKEPKFKTKFVRASRARAGEVEPAEVAVPTNVLDFEKSSMEVFIELGLLTEAEFDAMTGLSGTATVLKAEMASLPNYVGGSANKNFFIITLDGLSCSQIHAMRRVRVSYEFGLSKEDVLLSAGKQLLEGQGTTVFSYHSAEQLDSRPKGLREDRGLSAIKSLQELKEKGSKMMAKAGVEPKPENGQAESSDEDGSAKRVKQHSSGRLQKAILNKRPKARARNSGSKSLGRGKDDPVAALEDPSVLPKVLQNVAQALKVTPRCFINLDVPRILTGERLMRSVDAVPWPSLELC